MTQDEIHQLPDAEAVRLLLEMAADRIQTVMNYEYWTPGTYLADIAEMRQSVTKFSATARHLVQPRFGPHGWPSKTDCAQFDA